MSTQNENVTLASAVKYLSTETHIELGVPLSLHATAEKLPFWSIINSAAVLGE